MSLIIKGMKLPENDGIKELVIGRAPNGSEPIALVHGDMTEFYKVIELPAPHGRLIDADELLKAFKKACEQDGHWVNFFALVESAPTVIEAEENDEK